MQIVQKHLISPHFYLLKLLMDILIMLFTPLAVKYVFSKMRIKTKQFRIHLRSNNFISSYKLIFLIG